MPEPRRSGSLVPARFTVQLTAAVDPRRGEMSAVWDRLHEALDAMPGVFSEGGGSELMDPADLIPDSPLDVYIRENSDA